MGHRWRRDDGQGASALAPRVAGRTQVECIARNPAAVAEAPRARQPEMKTWDGAQVRAFFDATADHRLAALWKLLATTGLRRSEALGLRWGDLNVDETPGRLSVRQTLAYVGTRAVFDEPKTKRSRRLGLPKITLHGLRHSWASLALLDGIPSKVVAEVLGHSSTAVTENVYMHVTPGMQADATARVAALLRRHG